MNFRGTGIFLEHHIDDLLPLGGGVSRSKGKCHHICVQFAEWERVADGLIMADVTSGRGGRGFLLHPTISFLEFFRRYYNINLQRVEGSLHNREHVLGLWGKMLNEMGDVAPV